VTVINSDKLGKPRSLWQRIRGKPEDCNMVPAGADHVIITTHGAPGSVNWKGGKKGSATGDDIGEQLNKANFKGGPGARVDLLACNGATPGDKGKSPSVAEGIANKTKATTWGARANSNDPYGNPPAWE